MVHEFNLLTLMLAAGMLKELW